MTKRNEERRMFACFAMMGLLADPNELPKFKGLTCSQSVARHAVEYADDFATGQAQLPLEAKSQPNPDYKNASYEIDFAYPKDNSRHISMWALVKPDGNLVTGSDIESEKDAWAIGLGWPSPEDIEEHKAEGYYAALVSVKVPNNANS